MLTHNLRHDCTDTAEDTKQTTLVPESVSPMFGVNGKPAASEYSMHSIKKCLWLGARSYKTYEHFTVRHIVIPRMRLGVSSSLSEVLVAEYEQIRHAAKSGHG